MNAFQYSWPSWFYFLLFLALGGATYVILSELWVVFSSDQKLEPDELRVLVAALAALLTSTISLLKSSVGDIQARKLAKYNNKLGQQNDKLAFVRELRRPEFEALPRIQGSLDQQCRFIHRAIQEAFNAKSKKEIPKKIRSTIADRQNSLINNSSDLAKVRSREFVSIYWDTLQHLRRYSERISEGESIDTLSQDWRVECKKLSELLDRMKEIIHEEMYNPDVEI